MYKYVIGIFGVCLLVGLGYSHYLGLLNEVDELKFQNEKQQQIIASQNDAIMNWEKNNKKLTELIENMQKVSEQANKQIDILNDIFSKHDIENLAKEKPKLIENRINNGTADIMRMLECSSGANCEPQNSKKSNRTKTPTN